MARYNEIQVGHPNRFLQKVTGIKGAVPSPTLAPEIFPFLEIFSGTENRYLAAWGIFGNYQNVTGAVGNQSGVQLLNPVGSNVIAVILRFYFSSNTLGNMFVSNTRGGPTPANLALSTPAASFDARSGFGNATCVLSGQSTPSVPNLNSQIAQFNIAVINTDYDIIQTIDQEIPLLPGDAVRIVLGATNSNVKGGAIWRERFLEESERT